MSITQEQIEKIAKKLGKLKARDTKKLSNNINSILDYVSLLNEIDTSNVIPTVSVIQKENILKEDVVLREIDPKDLLKCSPQQIIQNQIAISSIMK